MKTKFNFNSQVCTDKNQSERLLALGLKKETADMAYRAYGRREDGVVECATIASVSYGVFSTHDIPAWSLHRLIEILDTNPCVFYTNCGYDNIIDRIEEYIKEGIIDTRYLQEWCLNEEE